MKINIEYGKNKSNKNVDLINNSKLSIYTEFFFFKSVYILYYAELNEILQFEKYFKHIENEMEINLNNLFLLVDL